MARIKSISSDEILFDNGCTISYSHFQECCEYNYADFEQLDDIAKNTDFDTDHMLFEPVEEAGFKFGNPNKMFFVPCYSAQNGYYSDDIDIYWNNEHVLNFNCEEVLY